MRRALLTHLFIETVKKNESEVTLKAIHEVLQGCCISSSLEPQQKEPNCWCFGGSWWSHDGLGAITCALHLFNLATF